MAEGHNENVWMLASAVMALLANCHRDPKKPVFTPEQFNPTVQRTERTDVIHVTPENIGEMREAFGQPQVPRVRAST